MMDFHTPVSWFCSRYFSVFKYVIACFVWFCFCRPPFLFILWSILDLISLSWCGSKTWLIYFHLYFSFLSLCFCLYCVCILVNFFCHFCKPLYPQDNPSITKTFSIQSLKPHPEIKQEPHKSITNFTNCRSISPNLNMFSVCLLDA